MKPSGKRAFRMPASGAAPGNGSMAAGTADRIWFLIHPLVEGGRLRASRSPVAGPCHAAIGLPDRPDAAKPAPANEKSMKRQPERRPVVHFHRLASCLSR
jgi:hypothetical protein